MVNGSSNSGGDRKLNIEGNRRARKWSSTELLGRFLWEVIGGPLFALSPRQLWGFRRSLLRLFGAKIGKGVNIFPSVRIAVPWNLTINDFAAVGDGAIVYSLGNITIGARATVSQYAHLCAGSHDYLQSSFDLLKPPISLGADSWICASAFIGPGVKVGDRAVVAAGAVVAKDVAPDSIVGGNPARFIRERPRLTNRSDAMSE
jgi:putative colanic acid biosynthesis acetyltransferase WcaF